MHSWLKFQNSKILGSPLSKILSNSDNIGNESQLSLSKNDITDVIINCEVSIWLKFIFQ